MERKRGTIGDFFRTPLVTFSFVPFEGILSASFEADSEGRNPEQKMKRIDCGGG